MRPLLGSPLVIVDTRLYVKNVCAHDQMHRERVALPGSFLSGAYLLGVMAPELINMLGIKLPLLRRDPHYFLPTTGQFLSTTIDRMILLGILWCPSM